MLWLLCLALFGTGQEPALRGTIDASQLQTTAPAFVGEIDLGRLKGEPRQLAWSPDGLQLYLQTVDGKPPATTARHYTIELADGRITSVEQAPDWAVSYWTVKQDRVAPGVPALEIAVDRRQETVKSGTGSAGVLDRSSNPTSVAMAGPTPENLANGNFGNQRNDVLVLSLQGQEIIKWVNTERPIPGTRFSWGPHASGALVYVRDDGRLVFFDQAKHRVDVEGPKDAWLPAWSIDGARLAYLQKTAKKKYAVMWVGVAKR